jgi:hypothetical protein
MKFLENRFCLPVLTMFLAIALPYFRFFFLAATFATAPQGSFSGLMAA